MKLIDKLVKNKTDDFKIQFARYLIVGGIAFLFDFLTLFFFTEIIILHYLISNILGFIVGLVINYSLSISWVFNKRTLGSKSAEFTVFAIIGIIGLALNELFLWIFTDAFGVYYLISKLIATLLVLIWNFVSRRFILFTK